MRILLACVIWAFAAAAHAAPLTVLAPALSAEAQETFSKEYGLREFPPLQKSLQSRIERQLAKTGGQSHATNGVQLRITLLEAKPSRLTYEQQRGRSALDYAFSRSLGGAKLRAELLDGSGNVIDTLNYAWYEYDLRSSQAITPWFDTERAFTFFAAKLGKWYRARA